MVKIRGILNARTMNVLSQEQGKSCVRDCAIIIRRVGAEKLEGGALHKIAAKIRGLKVKSLI